jgi:hypothetical protein
MVGSRGIASRWETAALAICGLGLARLQKMLGTYER